jgi:AcrR family transcriptional regulator
MDGLSVTDKAGGWPVTKNENDVRTRLQGAALELFRERGYDRTTAAEIAARAGVTERTFFRYFPDKREVLFDGEAVVRAALTASIADAPAGLGPLDTLFRAFRSFQPALEANWSYSKPRHAVISATPALHERELAKIAALTDALAAALKARGVADLRAVLAARTGMAAFVHATLSWLDDPAVGLGERIDLAFREMKALLAESD